MQLWDKLSNTHTDDVNHVTDEKNNLFSFTSISVKDIAIDID